MSTVLENCRISPPSATVGEKSLPLTFFDIIWLLHFPIHQLFFYDFPHAKSDFIETVIPILKHSLSITLQHFFPFASNLIVFPNPTKPEIRHVDGDSVDFTVAECHLKFEDLIGNHPRACDKFHHLVPRLGRVITKASEFISIPLFAVQITYFENFGFSIGITNHHVLCDASTKFDFLKVWTSIARNGTDAIVLANGSLPIYDRLLKYPESIDEIFMNQPGVEALNADYQIPDHELVGPSSKVRATFFLTKERINLLKLLVCTQLPKSGLYISSFSVACGYIWSCIAKSRVGFQERKGAVEDELERFVCLANFRSRMDPPLPETYFGNCVGPCVAVAKSMALSGNEGFRIAVESIAEAISKTVKKKDGMLKDAELWFELLFRTPAKIPAKIGVAGTPKLKIYDVDFGWGKPRKYETVSIDRNGSISVNACKESPEDLEIGLSLPAKQMDAFVAIFNNDLKNNRHHPSRHSLRFNAFSDLSSLSLSDFAGLPFIFSVSDSLSAPLLFFVARWISPSPSIFSDIHCDGRERSRFLNLHVKSKGNQKPTIEDAERHLSEPTKPQR